MVILSGNGGNNALGNERKYMTYRVTDGNGESEIEAESARAACQKWVDTGDYGSGDKTTWVTCVVRQDKDEEGSAEGETERHTIEVPPTVAECWAGEHDWVSPLSVVGGCAENPGVQGHGGGVKITEVCCYCGRYRIEDTWAQNPATGEQGLESVEYREADEISEAWLTRHLPRRRNE
jgi:hypothetical protein